jgi:hypothetical protein
MTEYAKLATQARRLFERNEARDRHFGDDLADAIEALVKERDELQDAIRFDQAVAKGRSRVAFAQGREAGIREASDWMFEEDEYLAGRILALLGEDKK